jgi:hypothetical protein
MTSAPTDALQTALAAEHAAVFVYGALGGQTSQTDDPTLYAEITDAYLTHRDRRDELTSMVVDQGGYWQPLAALLRSSVEGGFASPSHLDHVAFIEDIDQLLPTLAAMPRGEVAEKELDRL